MLSTSHGTEHWEIGLQGNTTSLQLERNPPSPHRVSICCPCVHPECTAADLHTSGEGYVQLCAVHGDPVMVVSGTCHVQEAAYNDGEEATGGKQVSAGRQG